MEKPLIKFYMTHPSNANLSNLNNVSSDVYNIPGLDIYFHGIIVYRYSQSVIKCVKSLLYS